MKSTAAMESASSTTMAAAMLRKDWRRQAECRKRNHKTKNSRNTGFLHFGYLHFLRNFWTEFQNGTTSIRRDLYMLRCGRLRRQSLASPKAHFTPTSLAMTHRLFVAPVPNSPATVRPSPASSAIRRCPVGGRSAIKLIDPDSRKQIRDIELREMTRGAVEHIDKDAPDAKETIPCGVLALAFSPDGNTSAAGA
jgi:hypothetical protein